MRLGPYCAAVHYLTPVLTWNLSIACCNCLILNLIGAIQSTNVLEHNTILGVIRNGNQKYCICGIEYRFRTERVWIKPLFYRTVSWKEDKAMDSGCSLLHCM